MGIAGALWRVETRVNPSVSFSIPARRREFCSAGDLGSSNRPFPRRRPRSNGSAREPSGPDPAFGGETALEPNSLPTPERRSGSLKVSPRSRVDGSERSGPGLPRARDRTTPSEPSCPNHGGVRALSPAGHANDGGTTGLRAPPGIAIPIAPLQPRSHRGPGSDEDRVLEEDRQHGGAEQPERAEMED